MALQMTYKLGGDFDITAYVRIKEVHILHNPSKANALTLDGKGTGTKYVAKPVLEVKSAKNKNTLDTWNAEWFFAYDHTINKNPINQAYDYLKTLPEFSVIVDVND
jgi:hypothetical protein